MRFSPVVMCVLAAVWAATGGEAVPQQEREHGFPKPAEMSSEERLRVCDAFFRKMGRQVSLDFSETPLQEALTFMQTLLKCSVLLDPSAATAGTAQLKVTLRSEGIPYALAFDDLLGKAGLDWTIGGDQKLAIYLGSPEGVRKMNERYPDIAKAVAEFRERIRAESEALKARKDTPKE